jgi:hypothetical protein
MILKFIHLTTNLKDGKINHLRGNKHKISGHYPISTEMILLRVCVDH